MKYQPKFDNNNPQNNEEKLICELSKDLHDVQQAFINLNKKYSDHEIFITLRDGSLSFSGHTITALLNLMTDYKQKILFIKECQDIFNSYMDDALESIK